MSKDYFGEDVSARYDETIAGWGDPEVVEPAVDFLFELAGDGAALELGIGTGRIALPLAARGVRVHGIDLSEAMLFRSIARARDLEAAMFVGDDVGDLDAFAALSRLRAEGVWTCAIVARGPETSPEVAAAADLTVDGPEGVVALLARLADALVSG